MSQQIGKRRFEKHLRIGVRFDGTGFVLLNGEPLPKLTEGSVAELVVAPESIENANIRAGLSGQKSISFLDMGSVVFFGVSSTMVGEKPLPGLILPEDLRIAADYLFVEVKLGTDLRLQVRGDDEARLSPCDCTITALGKHAGSLNHAFTLISEVYETKRRSHSGNVFERGYVLSRSGGRTLDELRQEAIQRLVSGTENEAKSVWR